jgi:5'-deoxynucleotidase YfbR-like HD superfamily hydrolase
VAQHSVLVAEIFHTQNPTQPTNARLYALLHDASEYVIGDIISPLKAAMGGNYKEVEDRLLSTIHMRFSLPAQPSAAVKKAIKQADRHAAFYEAVNLAGFAPDEARQLFGNPQQVELAVHGFGNLIQPWPTQEAHHNFVQYFQDITPD